VVVAGVVTSLSVCLGKLLSRSLLSRGVDVLDLSLTKDTIKLLEFELRLGIEESSHVGIAVRRLVDFGVVDNEENL
jgi:hypothetical protein